MHTWNENDECEDTPINPNCWNVNEPNNGQCAVPSNNFMDYNAYGCAATICQVNRMHSSLLGNMGNISDCLISSVTVQNPTVNGTPLICFSGQNYSIDNLQLGVSVQWTATPSSLLPIAQGVVIPYLSNH
ncbi:MAG: hypothetical protein IPF54_10565 [Draconibacterium sp.]|nr:hypothetical protein [Draconibacterium sp.]